MHVVEKDNIATSNGNSKYPVMTMTALEASFDTVAIDIVSFIVVGVRVELADVMLRSFIWILTLDFLP